MEDLDPDEEFRKIMEGVELEEPTDAIDYTKLDDVQLSKEYQNVRQELFSTNQLHNKNPIGRAAELHSQFMAITAELHRRHPAQ